MSTELVRQRGQVYPTREAALAAGHQDAEWGSWAVGNSTAVRYGWIGLDPAEEVTRTPTEFEDGNFFIRLLGQQAARAGQIFYGSEPPPGHALDVSAETVTQIWSSDDPVEERVTIIHPPGGGRTLYVKFAWVRICGHYLVLHGTEVSGYDYRDEVGELYIVSLR
jgi:hypothetical protein